MNVNTLQRVCISLSLCLFLGFFLHAQDIHYSMFNRSPMNISPGLVGVFGGDMRITGNYRRQWNSVPVAYKTFTATLEHKLSFPKVKRGYFTGGLHFNYDDAGDLSLAQSQIGLSGAYIHPLTKKEMNHHFLSGGLQVALSQRNFNTQNLRVDAQFSGEGFNRNLPNQEEQFNDNATFVNFSGGLNYRFQNQGTDQNKRTRIDIGVAIFHLNRPNKSFIEGATSKLDSRYSLYGISSFKLLEDLDMGLLASGQFQGAHEEFVIGGNLRKYFGDNTAFLLGLSYRLGDSDALIPNLAFDYRNFSFGFSFDWNLSKFDAATTGNGGPEFSMIYTVGQPKSKVYKPCPIF